jgi:hypothetical protein
MSKSSPLFAIAILAALLLACALRVTAADSLAKSLATNAVAHAQNLEHPADTDDLKEVAGWSYNDFTATNLHFLTAAKWSTNFWLRDVRGLSATCIGYSNGVGGQGLVTMVSPRHYLFATHMHPEGYLTAFLGTNDVIYWRTTLERIDVDGDTSVGILNQDLPPEVGFLPVLPRDYDHYLPKNAVLQGIGMNQDMKVFSQPMMFGRNDKVFWTSRSTIPQGLSTNWSVAIRSGDSSNPEMLLIGHQLVLVSHNYAANGGPDYTHQFSAINAAMRKLSERHHAKGDYQLTTFPLDSWPPVIDQ